MGFLLCNFWGSPSSREIVVSHLCFNIPCGVVWRTGVGQLTPWPSAMFLSKHYNKYLFPFLMKKSVEL